MKCLVNIKGEEVEAQFIGVFQRSEVIGPSIMVGGHSGGTVSYPVAVVRLDCKLREFKTSAITFLERG